MVLSVPNVGKPQSVYELCVTLSSWSHCWTEVSKEFFFEVIETFALEFVIYKEEFEHDLQCKECHKFYREKSTIYYAHGGSLSFDDSDICIGAITEFSRMEDKA